MSPVRRAHSSCASANPTLNGGAWALGSSNNQPGETIDLKVLDGGAVDNQGQMWFGEYNDSEIDLIVTWEVGEFASIHSHGALENGISNDDTAGAGNEGDINFIYNYDDAAGATDDSTYSINMTGHGGSVTVDADGIRVQEEVAQDVWNSTLKTYQALYSEGRLLSDESNAAAFGDKFAVTGTVTQDDYRVVSIEQAFSTGAYPGDINGDGLQNAIDAGRLSCDREVDISPSQ